MSYLSYVENNLFARPFLEGEFLTLFSDMRYQTAFTELKDLYHATKFAALNEAQLEVEFIQPALQILGFSYAYQVSKKAQGRSIRPDFALFKSSELKDAHYHSDKETNESILALCESKAYNVVLDNKKIDKENPHFQLMDYLNSLKLDIGFLTNGKLWRFYNTHQNRADKVFYQINLEAIFDQNDIEAFRYFYDIFRVENFATPVATATTNNRLIERNEAAKMQIENDLRQVIYGKDSIVEAFGQHLFKKLTALALEEEYLDSILPLEGGKKKYSVDLKKVYENSVMFAFRLLFVAYFEDKFYDTLFIHHPHYKVQSLHRLVERMAQKPELYPKGRFNAWGELLCLFSLLDKGNDNFDIPLLNGGLFAADKAPYLTQSRVIPNEALGDILSHLLYSSSNPKERYIRDFRTLSVQHLGNIYEGLLEFEFRKVLDEEVFYLVFTESKKEMEGYFDKYDYTQLKNNKKVVIGYEQRYTSGEVYFSDKSSNRKTTASYYTPPAFTEFMASEALGQALLQHPNLLHLRFLDNACGSGHFLIELLQQLTNYTYQHLHDDDQIELLETFKTEREAVLINVQGYFGQQETLDELTLLKRLLLKKTIFGVDLNAFAIELTRLSLWLDTFIIGTPLSFIEHHIKQGNALIGSTRQQFLDSIQDGLFKESFSKKITDLIEQLNLLSDLKDNNAMEVMRSKQVFKDLSPTLDMLNRALHLATFVRFIPIEYADKEVAKHWTIQVNAALQNMQRRIFEGENQALIAEIERLAAKYQFFNYEIEFAELFINGHRGFDGIIGNPPWEKTKFDEAEFFAVYRSSYRTLPQSQKKEIRDNVLDYEGVQAEYDLRKDWVVNSNEFYKNNFPHNRGAGDNNLFRLFIENNLRLLKKTGALTCLTPSAWIYEDSSIQLRKYILEHYNLSFFYQFENREAIFPRVHRSYKFATFQIKPLDINDLPTTIRTRFMQTDVKILQTQEAILNYPIADIQGLSPKHSSFFEVKNNVDLEILRKVYQLFDSIDEQYIDFRRELDMTNDRDLFLEQKGGADDWILYEGKLIHQFNSKFEQPTYWVNQTALRQRLISVETSRLVDAIYEQIPDNERSILEQLHKTKEKTVTAYLGFNQKEELEPLLHFDYEFPRLAFRGIARNTDERTLISALLPTNNTYGHSMFANIPKYYVLKNKTVEIQTVSIQRELFVNTLLNSLVVDYVLRFVVDINVTKGYLMRLPIPQPNDTELTTNAQYKTLIRNAARLTISYNPTDFKELEKTLGIQASEIPTTDKQRHKLQAENDLIIKDLYQITDTEWEHLLSPAYFKVLNDKQAAYLGLLQ